jgi:hypothetical protein
MHVPVTGKGSPRPFAMPHARHAVDEFRRIVVTPGAGCIGLDGVGSAHDHPAVVRWYPWTGTYVVRTVIRTDIPLLSLRRTGMPEQNENRNQPDGYKRETGMNTTQSQNNLLGLLVLACLSQSLLSGCGKVVKKGFTNDACPVARVRSVAILPFDGVPEADTAADMISMVLSNRGAFDHVVDRARIQASLTGYELPSDLLDENTIVSNGKFINADAILKGRVTRFEQGAPDYPVATATRISMSLKLVSTETGQIIWTRLYSKKSTGRGLFAPDVDEMMIDMAEEIADDLVDLK